MIRPLALLLLLTGAGFVTTPTGWRADTEAAAELADKVNAVSQFGGTRALATAQVFVPAAGGGALYITAIAGKITEHREAAARAQVDSFLGAAKRGGLTSDKVTVTQSGSRIDPTAKLIEATLQWQDPSSVTHARLLLVGDANNLVAVSAECVLAIDVAAATRDACIAALATLDPGVPVDKRIPLALAPEGTEPPQAEGSATAPSTMSDGSRIPAAPASPGSAGTRSEPNGERSLINIPSEPKRTFDRRPVYVGAGIILLAGLFWWNRRRRERLSAASDNKDTDE